MSDFFPPCVLICHGWSFNLFDLLERLNALSFDTWEWKKQTEAEPGNSTSGRVEAAKLNLGKKVQIKFATDEFYLLYSSSMLKHTAKILLFCNEQIAKFYWTVVNRFATKQIAKFRWIVMNRLHNPTETNCKILLDCNEQDVKFYWIVMNRLQNSTGL